jgi:5-methylcytosine-specific restriction endonuclease McrA
VDHQIVETELIPRKEAKLRFRDQILLGWDYSCAYCRTPLDNKRATLDHVVPKVKGGLTVKENLIPACLGCNVSKSARDWEAWYREQAWWSISGEEAIRTWLKS